MLRAVRTTCLILIVLLGGVWATAWALRAPGESVGTSLNRRLAMLSGGEPAMQVGGALSPPPGVSLGGPFTLVDQAGHPVTERDFAGRWLLVYFGYTFCPDICPTELGAMAAALDTMGEAGEAVVPIFITVDPARDTPAHLADYVARFHPRLLGLSGTEEQVAAVARRYRVYYAKAQSAGMTDYLMDHSSFVYLVGPDGQVRRLFRPEARPEDMAATVLSELRAAQRPS